MSHTHTSASSSGWTPPTVEELHALLPQYEISAVLGQGGMGAVYKGRQTKLNRDVAIKILPENLGAVGDGEDDDAQQFVERFKLEAQSMANLGHPAILKVYDFGETSDGQLYLVMEFIDGMDIQAYLHHHGGRLVHEHAIAITAHVLDALQYAHDHGVVHRDIKPANVLINSEGRVKIADFGLAKRLTESEDEADIGLTSPNLVMGTPDFVAPEALEIGNIPDGRADLYAAGVMFYQMLTGKLPRGGFELPSALNPELDPRFDVVVSKALQANPDSRYGSATEFRLELDALLTKPVPKASDTRSPKIPAAPLRKKVPIKSRVPYPRPKPVAARKSKASLIVALGVVAAIVIGLVYFATRPPDSGKNNRTDVVQADASAKPIRAPEPIPEPIPAPAPPPESMPKPPLTPKASPTPSGPIEVAKSDSAANASPGSGMPDATVAKNDPPGVTAPDSMPADPRARLAAVPGLEPRLELYLKTRRKQVGEIAGKYLSALEAGLAQAAKAADLKLARAFEEEKARVAELQLALAEPPTDRFAAAEQPVTLPKLPAGSPEEVTVLRVTWDMERQKIRDDLNGKLRLSLQALEAELEIVKLSLEDQRYLKDWIASLPGKASSATTAAPENTAGSTEEQTELDAMPDVFQKGQFIKKSLAPDIGWRTVKFVATVDIDESKPNGTIVAYGGKNKGYALVVADESLQFWTRRNVVGKGLIDSHVSVPLADLPRAEFLIEAENSGPKMTISIDGTRRKTGSSVGNLQFKASEGLSVGFDSGSQSVGPSPPPDSFAGAIRDVRLELGHKKPKKQ